MRWPLLESRGPNWGPTHTDSAGLFEARFVNTQLDYAIDCVCECVVVDLT